MSKRKTHAPCPKCGSSNRSVSPVKHYFETQYKIKCPDCGFEIDASESRSAAWEVWDDISERKNT